MKDMITMHKFKDFMQKGMKDAAGKPLHIKKVPIRMASGKIEMHYPGKSGSSGGGGGGE